MTAAAGHSVPFIGTESGYSSENIDNLPIVTFDPTNRFQVDTGLLEQAQGDGGVLIRHDNDLLYDRLAACCSNPTAARTHDPPPIWCTVGKSHNITNQTRQRLS
jgi:hypothetical protein